MYAMTAGIATAKPATVVVSASAMPGATAAMLADPCDVIPMKEFITPTTVPMRPRRGTHGADDREPGQPVRKLILLLREALLEHQPQRFELRGAQPLPDVRGVERARAQFGEEGDPLPKHPSEGRIVEFSQRVVEVHEAVGPGHREHEVIRPRVHGAQLAELPR